MLFFITTIQVFSLKEFSMPFLREHVVQNGSYGTEDHCNCIVLTDELPIHSVRKTNNQKSKRKINLSGTTVPSYLEIFLLVGMRNGAISFLDVFNGLDNQMHFQAHSGTITDMHYRRERKELFVVGRGLVELSSSFSIHVWQLPEVEFLYRVTDLKDITCFAFSPTKEVFALGSLHGSVHLFASSSSSSISSSSSSATSAAAVVMDGSEKNKIMMLKAESVESSSGVSKPSVKEVFKPDQYHDATVNAVKFCDDLSIFVSACEDGVIKIWNFEKCLIRSLKLNKPCGGVLFNGKIGDILVVQGLYLLTIAKTTWDDGNAIEHMENNRDPWTSSTSDTIEKAAVSAEEATGKEKEGDNDKTSVKNPEQTLGSLENSKNNKNKNNITIIDDDSEDTDGFDDASSRNTSNRSPPNRGTTVTSIRASTISALLSSDSRSTTTLQRGTKMNSVIQRRDTKLGDAYQRRDTKLEDAYQRRDTKPGDAYQGRASNVHDIRRSTTISLNKNSKVDTTVPPQVSSGTTYSKADNLSFLKNSLGAKHSVEDPAAETSTKPSIFKALTEGVDREAFVTQKKTLCSSLNPLFIRDSNYSKLLVVRNQSNVLMHHPIRSEIIGNDLDGMNYMSSDPSHHLTRNYRTVASSSHHRSGVIDVLHPRFLIRTKPSVREEHLYERIDQTLQQLANQNSAIIDAKSRGGVAVLHDDSSASSIEEKHMKGSEDGVTSLEDCKGGNDANNNKQSIQSWQHTHKVAQLGLSPRARLTLISSRPVAIGADAQEELEQILLDAAGMGISADYRRHINHVKEQSDAVYKQLINKSSSGPHRLAIRRL